MAAAAAAGRQGAGGLERGASARAWQAQSSRQQQPPRSGTSSSGGGSCDAERRPTLSACPWPSACRSSRPVSSALLRSSCSGRCSGSGCGASARLARRVLRDAHALAPALHVVGTKAAMSDPTAAPRVAPSRGPAPPATPAAAWPPGKRWPAGTGCRASAPSPAAPRRSPAWPCGLSARTSCGGRAVGGASAGCARAAGRQVRLRSDAWIYDSWKGACCAGLSPSSSPSATHYSGVTSCRQTTSACSRDSSSRSRRQRCSHSSQRGKTWGSRCRVANFWHKMLYVTSDTCK